MNDRMRVGLDVTALLTGAGGVARYVREIGAALERQDVDLIRFAIGRGDHLDALPPRTRRVRTPLRVMHRCWALSGRPNASALAPGCDVVHTPDLLPPPTSRPLVLTVHDLVALEHPDLHPPRSVAVQRSQLRAAITRADIVIAVSHATAETLKTHGVDPDRIVVAPNGATRFRQRDPSVVPDDPYVLAVGSLTPRKGFETLVAAFSRAGLPRRFRLVLAGGDGWSAPAVRQAIERHDRDGRVICTGRVSDAQLAALYEGCIAACVPSIAEGFGLPVVEAAALGAVVVASDLPVFNEINGGVVLHAPPGDVDAWACALARVVGCDDYRREAERRACAVAERYTWERSAALTLAAYQRATRVLLSP